MNAVLTLMLLVNGLLLSCLLSFGVAMLRRWMFQGAVRNWIVACMPRAWRCDMSAGELFGMTPDEITMFICGESDMPKFFRKLLTCPLCMTAWIAAALTLTVAPLWVSHPYIAPAVWAAAAWLSFRFETSSNQ